MADDKYTGQGGVVTPADDVIPLTVGDDSNDLPAVCKGFYCTADATLVIITKAGQTRTIAVAAHVVYPIRVSRLKATGTSLNSGSFVALY